MKTRIYDTRTTAHVDTLAIMFLKSRQVRCNILEGTWSVFMNFAEILGIDLGSYNDAKAWPSSTILTNLSHHYQRRYY